jgi:hypothetical protein
MTERDRRSLLRAGMYLLVLAPCAKASVQETPVDLIHKDLPRGGWGFGHGAEFPGAKRDLTLRLLFTEKAGRFSVRPERQAQVESLLGRIEDLKREADAAKKP